MERIEINDLKSYINEDDNPISELNLRPMYMIDDFDELIDHQLPQEGEASQSTGVRAAS